MAKLRKCANRKCRKEFEPATYNQRFCGKVCKNREGQRKLRARARMNGRQREETTR